MRRGFLTSSFLLFAAALLLGIAGAVVMLLELRQDESSLIAEIERDIQSDFSNMVQETAQVSDQLASEYAERRSLGAGSPIVRLALNHDCQLVDWNNSELMPSPRIIQDLCSYPNRRTLQDKNKIYYLLRNEASGFQVITLIPVVVDYKVVNSFLPRQNLSRSLQRHAHRGGSDRQV